MADISGLSETDASNTSISGVSVAELCAPSNINDAIRNLAGMLKRDWDKRGPTMTTGGSANAQTLTPSVAQASIVRGDTYAFVAGFTNTGAMTLAVSGLTAKAVQLGGAALRGMEICAGLTYTVMYDGTAYQLVDGVLPFTPNTLINGGFEVWQRGAGGSASIAVAATTTAYTADRWYITTAANQASVVSQQTGLTNGSRYCGRFQRNSGQTGTGAIVAGQPYTTDMLVPLRGSKITISGWLASGANWSPTSGNLTISFYTGTGTEGKRGGGFTSETTVVTTTVALTAGSSATFFSATSSAVLPTTATQGELQLTWTPVGTASTNDHFSIDDAKVEPNLGPSPFDRPLFVLEHVECMRFYQKSFKYATAPVQNVGSATDCAYGVAGKAGAASESFYMTLHVPLRDNSPTITYFNPVAANAQAIDITAGNLACSATATSITGSARFLIGTTGNASTAVGNALAVHFTAEMEL